MTRSDAFVFALALAVATMNGGTASTQTASSSGGVVPGAAGEPYPGMPAIAPIGARIGKYMDVPASARGPAIDPAKGYRRQDLGKGLSMVTDGVYQSMFLVYDSGVVVIDAPPSYAARIPQAIAEVTDKPITHVVYSHSHTDHIGGIKALGGHPVIVAHEETLRLLKRAADPNRPLPTVTFADRYTLRAGGQVLELSYHGNGHQPGNIFISAPAQRVLMVVDVVFPGWMPWRRFAVAQDVLAEVARTATYSRAYAEDNGFLTLLSDGDRLIGAYALGAEAGEWLQQATLAIRARVPLDVLRDVIQPFPTFSEIYAAALKALAHDVSVARERPRAASGQ